MVPEGEVFALFQKFRASILAWCDEHPAEANKVTIKQRVMFRGSSSKGLVPLEERLLTCARCGGPHPR